MFRNEQQAVVIDEDSHVVSCREWQELSATPLQWEVTAVSYSDTFPYLHTS